MMRCTLTLACLAMTAVMPAIASAGFGPAGALLGGQGTADDQALSADGTFASAFTNVAASGTGAVKVLLRRPDGTVAGLRAVGLPRGGRASPARLALGPEGRVTVVWTQGRKVAAARCSAGGCGRSIVLGRTARRDGEPRVAADSRGRVLVLWRGRLSVGPVEDRDRLQWRLATRGRFGPARSFDEFGSQLALGIDGRGRALAAWTAGDGVGGAALRVAERIRGDFSAPLTVSPPDTPATGARIAANRHGETILAWRAAVVGAVGAGGPVLVAIRSANGGLGTPVTVSDPAAQAGDLRLALGAAGHAVLSWADFGAASQGALTQSVVVAVRPPGARFAAPVALTGPVDLAAGAAVQPLAAAVDDAGTATVAWVQRGAPVLGAAPDTLEVAQAAAGTPLGPPRTFVNGRLAAPLVSSAGRRTVLTFGADAVRFAAQSVSG